MSLRQDNCPLCAGIFRPTPKQPGYVFEHEVRERRRKVRLFGVLAALMYVVAIAALMAITVGLLFFVACATATVCATFAGEMLAWRARWKKNYPSAVGYVICELETGLWHTHLRAFERDSEGRPGFTIYHRFHPVHQLGLCFPSLGDNEAGQPLDLSLVTRLCYRWDVRLHHGGAEVRAANGREDFGLSPKNLLAALRFMQAQPSLFDFVEHVLKHETPDAPRGRAVELEAAIAWLADRVQAAAPQPLHGRTMANVLEVISPNHDRHFDDCPEAEHARGVEMIAKLNAAVKNGGLGVGD